MITPFEKQRLIAEINASFASALERIVALEEKVKELEARDAKPAAPKQTRTRKAS